MAIDLVHIAASPGQEPLRQDLNRYYQNLLLNRLYQRVQMLLFLLNGLTYMMKPNTVNATLLSGIGLKLNSWRAKALHSIALTLIKHT